MRTILFVVFSALALNAIATSSDYSNNPAYINNNDDHSQDGSSNRRLVRSNTYNGSRRDSINNQQYPAPSQYNDSRDYQVQSDRQYPNQMNNHRMAPRNTNDYEQNRDDRYYRNNQLNNGQVIEHPDSYKKPDINRDDYKPSSNANTNEVNASSGDGASRAVGTNM